MKHVVFKIVAVCFMLLGFIGWMIPYAGQRFWNAHTELPNTEARGIIVDNDGNIYCCSEIYGRIQKYHPDGSFICGYQTGWERNLVFEITDHGQLCTIHSYINKDLNSITEYRKYYDPEGKLVGSQDIVKKNKHYTREMNNTATDSVGNNYLYKGFLFPRVIKQTPSGEKSVLIHTPVFLWFVQAPFPAFAFFFISMMTLIIDSFRQKAKKLSVPTFDLVFDRKSLRLPSLKKLISFAMKTLGVCLVFFTLLAISFLIHPVLFISGLVGLGVIFVLIWLSAIIYSILYQWRCKKENYQLWKDSISGASPKVRYEACFALRSLNDPVIKKIEDVFRKTFIYMLWSWCILLILAISIVLYSGRSVFGEFK